MSESSESRALLVGMNHVALEVDDVDEAVAFYEDLFAFELRSRSDSSAFVDMGDQFLALMETDGGSGDGGRERGNESRQRNRDEHRHVGLVVDDIAAVETRLDDLGVERLDTSGVDFYDPSGNRIQVVDYEAVQFTKAQHVLDGMGLTGLEKTESARSELAKKGMAPE